MMRENSADTGAYAGKSLLMKPNVLLAVPPASVEEFLPSDLCARLEALPINLIKLPLPLEKESEWKNILIRSHPEVLISGWGTPAIPADLPVGENGLRYLCHLTGSVRHLVPRELIVRGLRVSNWGKSISRTIAECALLLTLASLRKLSYYSTSLHRDGGWGDGTVTAQSLFTRNIGIHGFGNIAQILVTLLKPFGGKITTYDPPVPDDILARHGVARAQTLESLFAENDVIIELAAYTPENYHLVTEKYFRLIRPGGVFVNVGRGAVTDETALARVAAEGKIQVGLDVFETEPLPLDSPFRKLENVTLLPHMSGPTVDRRRDAGELAVQNLELYLAGKPLKSELTVGIYDRQT